MDNNCDGSIDEGVTNVYFIDADGDGFGDLAVQSEPSCVVPDGYVVDNTDCDDDDAQNYPGNAELCDGKDNDCDGVSDEADAVDAVV